MALASRMKTSGALVLLALCGLSAAYDEKYDHIDVDKILADEQMFLAYTGCLLDQGPCELQYSQDYRRILPEVIETACGKCTPKQEENVRKSVMALQEKLPEKFKEFEAKYDPKGEHREKFALFVAKSS